MVPVPPIHNSTMGPRTAKSIFEYLTSKNPEITYKVPTSTSLHSDATWKWPQQLIPWDDFSFESMENVFKGELMRECRMERELHYPPPPTVWDNNEAGEDSSVEILSNWTNTILKQALNAVVLSLNPVGRVAGSLCRLKVDGQSGTPFRPDGGSVTPSDLGETSRATLRIPSDVKPASCWESSVFLERTVCSDGTVNRKTILKPYAGPVRQIYTYCVEYKARYGFLLTSKEVFLVRVGPNRTADDESGGEAELKQALKDRGLMEYKSIPWEAHRAEQSIDEYRELTMNLSLWCLHVLAGSNYEIQWRYGSIEQEEQMKPAGLHSITMASLETIGSAIGTAENTSQTQPSASSLAAAQSFMTVTTSADTVR